MAKHKDVLEAERRIREAIAAEVDYLDLSGLHSLTSLSGLDVDIADAKSLTSLNINGTSISDSSPIAKLTGLEQLYFGDTQISDISPIMGLKGIGYLDLDGTQVSDLFPLAKMTKIRALSVHDTPITDFTPLSKLHDLRLLHLRNTEFSALKDLPRTARFETLDLRDTKVADLRPLLDLTFEGEFNLFTLRVTNTPAARADPRIAEIDAMEDHPARVKALLEYVATLPSLQPRRRDVEALLRGPILSDTLSDVTKLATQFEATSLSDHPDKTPDDKFNDIVGTLQFAAQKLGATDVQNRLGKDVAQSFREYTTFVAQDPLNPRILRFLGDSIRGAISNEDTAAALDAFDVPLFENFLREHDALLSGYFNKSLAPVEFDVETDPDKLIKGLFPQLEAARKILANADAAGLFAPSVSDALEMLHRRAEGARKKIITTGDETEREAAIDDLRRASVLTTSFLGRIKGRLTQWVEKQAAFAKENPGTTALATDGLYTLATKVIEQVTPIFDALWKLIGNLPLPF